MSSKKEMDGKGPMRKHGATTEADWNSAELMTEAIARVRSQTEQNSRFEVQAEAAVRVLSLRGNQRNVTESLALHKALSTEDLSSSNSSREDLKLELKRGQRGAIICEVQEENGLVYAESRNSQTKVVQVNHEGEGYPLAEEAELFAFEKKDLSAEIRMEKVRLELARDPKHEIVSQVEKKRKLKTGRVFGKTKKQQEEKPVKQKQGHMPHPMSTSSVESFRTHDTDIRQTWNNRKLLSLSQKHTAIACQLQVRSAPLKFLSAEKAIRLSLYQLGEESPKKKRGVLEGKSPQMAFLSPVFAPYKQRISQEQPGTKEQARAVSIQRPNPESLQTLQMENPHKANMEAIDRRTPSQSRIEKAHLKHSAACRLVSECFQRSPEQAVHLIRPRQQSEKILHAHAAANIPNPDSVQTLQTENSHKADMEAIDRRTPSQSRPEKAHLKHSAACRLVSECFQRSPEQAVHLIRPRQQSERILYAHAAANIPNPGSVQTLQMENPHKADMEAIDRRTPSQSRPEKAHLKHSAAWRLISECFQRSPEQAVDLIRLRQQSEKILYAHAAASTQLQEPVKQQICQKQQEGTQVLGLMAECYAVNTQERADPLHTGETEIEVEKRSFAQLSAVDSGKLTKQMLEREETRVEEMSLRPVTQPRMIARAFAAADVIGDARKDSMVQARAFVAKLPDSETKFLSTLPKSSSMVAHAQAASKEGKPDQSEQLSAASSAWLGFGKRSATRPEDDKQLAVDPEASLPRTIASSEAAASCLPVPTDKDFREDRRSAPGGLKQVFQSQPKFHPMAALAAAEVSQDQSEQLSAASSAWLGFGKRSATRPEDDKQLAVDPEVSLPRTIASSEAAASFLPVLTDKDFREDRRSAPGGLKEVFQSQPKFHPMAALAAAEVSQDQSEQLSAASSAWLGFGKRSATRPEDDNQLAVDPEVSLPRTIASSEAAASFLPVPTDKDFREDRRSAPGGLKEVFQSQPKFHPMAALAAAEVSQDQSEQLSAASSAWLGFGKRSATRPEDDNQLAVDPEVSLPRTIASSEAAASFLPVPTDKDFREDRRTAPGGLKEVFQSQPKFHPMAALAAAEVSQDQSEQLSAASSAWLGFGKRSATRPEDDKQLAVDPEASLPRTIASSEAAASFLPVPTDKDFREDRRSAPGGLKEVFQSQPKFHPMTALAAAEVSQGTQADEMGFSTPQRRHGRRQDERSLSAETPLEIVATSSALLKGKEAQPESLHLLAVAEAEVSGGEKLDERVKPRTFSVPMDEEHKVYKERTQPRKTVTPLKVSDAADLPKEKEFDEAKASALDASREISRTQSQLPRVIAFAEAEVSQEPTGDERLSTSTQLSSASFAQPRSSDERAKIKKQLEMGYEATPEESSLSGTATPVQATASASFDSRMESSHPDHLQCRLKRMLPGDGELKKTTSEPVLGAEHTHEEYREFRDAMNKGWLEQFLNRARSEEDFALSRATEEVSLLAMSESILSLGEDEEISAHSFVVRRRSRSMTDVRRKAQFILEDNKFRVEYDEESDLQMTVLHAGDRTKGTQAKVPKLRECAFRFEYDKQKRILKLRQETENRMGILAKLDSGSSKDGDETEVESADVTF